MPLIILVILIMASGLLSACTSGPHPFAITIDSGGASQPTTLTGQPAGPADDASTIPVETPESEEAAPDPIPTYEVPIETGAIRSAPPRPTLIAFTQEVPGTAVSFEMTPVPAGAPGHTPPASFWIGKTEVTWDLFDVYLFNLDEAPDHVDLDAIARPSKPYISMDRGFGHAGYPVISPSHHSAQTFCRWLSQNTGRIYRLPTVAEWQYVCAMGGVDTNALGDYAWTKENADFTTHPVEKKSPDALGVHDLLGNASEWATGDDGAPVTLGGCFRDKRDEVACENVVPQSPDWNASDPQIPQSIWWLADGGFVGFRVVCVP